MEKGRKRGEEDAKDPLLPDGWGRMRRRGKRWRRCQGVELVEKEERRDEEKKGVE